MIGARPPIMVQIDALAIDLAALQALTATGSPDGHGAGLVAAHAALMLAVTPAIDGQDQIIREDALHDAKAILAEAGFGHVGGLVEAALAFDIGAAALARGTVRPQ